MNEGCRLCYKAQADACAMTFILIRKMMATLRVTTAWLGKTNKSEGGEKELDSWKTKQRFCCYLVNMYFVNYEPQIQIWR